MDVIKIDKYSFQYQEKQVLDEVCLNIKKGEKIGLIGANGAGKTTLFLCISGVLSGIKGEIRLFNKIVKPGKFYPEIGLVFQNSDDQLFCPTVRDDVAFGPENMGLSPSEVSRRVERSLAITGVPHLADRVPHQLSGGEKCMVAIASVLAMEPEVILYDEPSANLDLKARRRLIEFLRASPQTLLVASHDLELILEVCDRVVLLSRGNIVAQGNPPEIMGNEELMEANNLEVSPSLKGVKSEKLGENS